MNADVSRVLLIEDNPGDAYLVRKMLAEKVNCYALTWVERLSAGLELLASEEFDVALCDLSLPDSRGLETPMRVQAAAPATPIVVMTSLDDEETAVESVHAGAQDYLVKSQINAIMLHRTIRYACERKQTLEQLRSYAAALEQRNAELDAFAHTVAHDLKNPVAGVIGLAEILRDQHGLLDPADEVDMLNNLVDSGHTMHKIIQELMLLAQVNRTEVVRTPLAMFDLVEQARQRLAQSTTGYAGEITLTAPERWPIAIGYGPWVEEVWVNYLSNALKYGGSPPQVTVGGDLCEGGQARFWVRDNGPGIPSTLQDRLFLEFSRLSQAPGHGLGLSIVRRIVEKLGGSAGVDSKEGRGSTFYFTLPSSTGKGSQQ